MRNLRNRLSVLAAMVSVFVFAAMPAWAEPPDPVDEANTAISDGVSGALDIVVTNIPLILGVAVAFVALKYGRRLLARL